jgi:trigger factor
MIVKQEIKEISPCVREIHLTVESERTEADFQAVLREFARYAVVPGFRKGKAPMRMVEQMYGSHARDEFVQRKLQDYYVEAIDAVDQHPITEGKPVTFSWDRGQDLTAVFHYEVKPEVVVQKHTGLEIPFEMMTLADDDLDHQIEHIREHSGAIEPVEGPVESGDFVSVTMQIPSADGEPSSVNREIHVNGDMYSTELHQNLIGKVVGDRFESMVINNAKDDSPFSKPLTVIINGIKRNHMPPLDDEFAKDLGYESLAEMRAKVAEEMQRQIDQQNKKGLKNAIVDKLIEENPVEAPPSAVERYARELAEAYAKENGGRADQLLPLYKIFAERDFKKYYIVEKLKQMEPVEVTDTDRDEMIAELAANVGVTPEEYRDRYSAQIESEDFADAIVEKIIFDRIQASSTLVKPKQPENIEE